MPDFNIQTPVINASDCSDEELLHHIANIRGEDSLDYKWKWIILRTLKILVKDLLSRNTEIDKK